MKKSQSFITAGSLAFLLHELPDPFLISQSVGRLSDRRVVGEHVEFLFFDSQDLLHGLIHGVLTQQMVDQHVLHLAHPVDPGNGLPGEGGLDLRLTEDHDARSLDIESGAAGLDLADQDSSLRSL